MIFAVMYVEKLDVAGSRHMPQHPWLCTAGCHSLTKSETEVLAKVFFPLADSKLLKQLVGPSGISLEKLQQLLLEKVPAVSSELGGCCVGAARSKGCAVIYLV